MNIIEKINDNFFRYAEKIAITYKNESLRYAEVQKKSEVICRFLSRRMQKQSVVCVCTERNHLLPVVFLGILKAGMIYLPISKFTPKERTEFIRQESGAFLMIVDETWEKTEDSDKNIVCIEEILSDETVSEAGVDRLEEKAYIIFTSGSTGKPKGVIVLSKGMENHLLSKINLLSLKAADHVMQNASECFDISIWQMLAPLIVGGTVHVVDSSEIFLMNNFLKLVEKFQISILEVVPSYLQSIIKVICKHPEKAKSLQGIRFILVTGEETKANTVNAWNELKTGIRLINAYGPTEASDDITHYIIDPEQRYSCVPLGREIINTKIYILDEDGREVKDGEVGEVCVAGVCVGGGYINNPDMTSKVFIDNPYDKDEKYCRMYKTGDLGHWGKEHLLYYHGRIDNQVKVNGYRIELGEIEQKSTMIPGIENAVVICKKGVLWMAYSSAEQLELDEISSKLAETLPQYMLPKNIVYFKKLPLNQNGKLDRKEIELLLGE